MFSWQDAISFEHDLVFRNPTAHAAKIEWNMPEDDAIDLFTLASYVIRRIEKATK
jgi:hypothetical protein